MSDTRLPTPLAAEPGHARVRRGSDDHGPTELARALRSSGVAVADDDRTLDEHARDWWPISIGWAAHGELDARPSLVARPTTTEQVAACVAACAAAGSPLVVQGGRSGVCGGAAPEPDAVAVDLTGLEGVRGFDDVSLRVRVGAGTLGPALESWLRDRGCTIGHFPQSFDLATVGGWVACRGAGQYSTRYGKVEDLVRGLTVVLPDATVIETGGRGPREAIGPDLTQLFVGAEGTLGIVTEVELVVHPIPAAEARRAYAFATFEDGLEACRRTLRRGATPAVLRLYDEAETTRHFGVEGCALVVLDEADPMLVQATMAILDEECAGARREDDALVAGWLSHRNDVSALGPLWERGVVVDTIETAGPWSILPALHREVTDAIESVPGTSVATVHQSHAYLDGACLYFTFAGRPEADPDGYYRQVWATATRAILRRGASLSHHHGVGRNRASFVADALGPALGVLRTIKAGLDPTGTCNPGVLGLGGEAVRP